MRKILILPILAVALIGSACEEDGDPTGTTTQANVRFVNAVTGVNGNLAFTANGNFATGSALGFGQQSTQCSTINSGSSVPIAFGAANATSTGIQGTALTTANQNISSGGNFTVVAAGSQTSPQLFVLNNAVSGSIGANQAAVRFVNLAPGTGTTANTFNVFTGTSATGTATASGIAFGAPTTFNMVTAGTNNFTITNSTGTSVISSSAGQLNLQAGSVNTVAVIPNTTSGGFQIINITRC